MDITSRALSEPGQANRNTKSPDKSRLESNLGFNFAILTELRLLGPVQVEEEGRGDDQGADEDASEGAAFLAGSEIVGACEDYDEGFEPDVGKAVDAGDVAAIKKRRMGSVESRERRGRTRVISRTSFCRSCARPRSRARIFNFSLPLGLRRRRDHL